MITTSSHRARAAPITASQPSLVELFCLQPSRVTRCPALPAVGIPSRNDSDAVR